MTQKHLLEWTYDGYRANPKPVCESSEDDWCRTAVPCECERFSPEKDDLGWYHIAYNPDFDIDNPDSEEEVEHRHVPSDKCSIVEHMENDDALDENGPQVGLFVVGRHEIKVTYEDEFYGWEPVKAEETAA